MPHKKTPIDRRSYIDAQEQKRDEKDKLNQIPDQCKRKIQKCEKEIPERTRRDENDMHKALFTCCSSQHRQNDTRLGTHDGMKKQEQPLLTFGLFSWTRPLCLNVVTVSD